MRTSITKISKANIDLLRRKSVRNQREKYPATIGKQILLNHGKDTLMNVCYLDDDHEVTRTNKKVHNLNPMKKFSIVNNFKELLFSDMHMKNQNSKIIKDV